MKKCRMFLFSAVLAGLAMAGLAPPARANFQVQFKFGAAIVTLDRTSGTTTVAGGASITGAVIDYSVAGEISVLNLVVSTAGTTGGFKISATIADSNSPGTTAVASIDNSSLKIVNQTGTAGNSSLTITTGDTGFTKPTGSIGVLTSTISVTAAGTNLGSTNGVVFNSYIDTANAQFGIPGTGATSTITLSPIAAGTSQASNVFKNVSTSPTPYSLTQVGVYTLANGDRFSDGSSGTSVMPTPAPAGFALLLSGIPMLYLGVRASRRRIATVV